MGAAETSGFADPYYGWLASGVLTGPNSLRVLKAHAEGRALAEGREVESVTGACGRQSRLVRGRTLFANMDGSATRYSPEGQPCASVTSSLTRTLASVEPSATVTNSEGVPFVVGLTVDSSVVVSFRHTRSGGAVGDAKRFDSGASAVV